MAECGSEFRGADGRWQRARREGQRATGGAGCGGPWTGLPIVFQVLRKRRPYDWCPYENRRRVAACGGPWTDLPIVFQALRKRRPYDWCRYENRRRVAARGGPRTGWTILN